MKRNVKRWRGAYQATDVKKAQHLLLDLARRLEDEYPSAAESVREGGKMMLRWVAAGVLEAVKLP